MNFKTHNAIDIEINGSCLQGEIRATYAELVSLFGEPFDGDGYKVDAEWGVRWDDGTIATIYNWKDGPNYCGEDGTPVKQINEWHVGGVTRAAIDRVQITLDLHREGAGKKKSAFEELVEGRDDMLATLKTQRGENFAKAVWFANMTQKQAQLFNLLLTTAGEPPPHVADTLADVYSNLCAQMLDAFCEQVGVASDVDGAKDLLAWADRLSGVEQSGFSALLARRGRN